MVVETVLVVVVVGLLLSVRVWVCCGASDGGSGGGSHPTVVNGPGVRAIGAVGIQLRRVGEACGVNRRGAASQDDVCTVMHSPTSLPSVRPCDSLIGPPLTNFWKNAPCPSPVLTHTQHLSPNFCS